MTTSQMIADFTTLAIQAGGWMELDRLYLQNRLLSMIGEQELGGTIVSNCECQPTCKNRATKRTVHGAFDGFVNTATFCG